MSLPPLPLPARSAYLDAVYRSRARSLALEATAARQVHGALGEWVDGVMAEYSATGRSGRATLGSAVSTSSLHGAMGAKLEQAVATGQTLSYADTQALWRQTAAEARRHLPAADLAGLRLPDLARAQAFSAANASATWRTALRGHVNAAGQDMDSIIRQALLNRTPARELAKQLRGYVQGAEEFHKAFPGTSWEQLADLRKRLPPDLRDAARRIQYNANRIAVSEIQNARAAAEIEEFKADPLVAGIIWTVSPNRGKLGRTCVCDALASINAWGLGKGVFPVDRCPSPPHPHCRCSRSPVLRPASEAGQPKPQGQRISNAKLATLALPERPRGTASVPAGRLTPAERDRIRGRVQDHLDRTAAL